MSDFTSLNGYMAKDAELRSGIADLSARVDNLDFFHISLEDYFASLRDGKVYRVKIPKYSSNTTTVCVKQLDNASLVAEPSTDAVMGRDDYLDIPLFQWWHCNYVRLSNGTPVITAIEGDNKFKTSGTGIDVGSFGMSFYHKWSEDSEAYYWTISDSPNDEYDLEPWGEFVDEGGNRMPYWCYSAYHGLWSQPNLPAYINQSYSTCITNYQTKGTGYWGAGYDKFAFAHLMIMMKYGDLGAKSSQNIFKGCTDYNLQYDAAYKDSAAHTYFPLTSAQAANIAVGSWVAIGYASLNTSTGALNKDRGQATVKSKVSSAKVLKKETVTLDGVDYVGIYLDIPDSSAFNTLDTDVSTTTYPDTYSPAMLSTMPWGSGSTDSVIGKRDGSLSSNTDSKHPFRIMGIEYMIGAYDVVADTVMYINSNYDIDFWQAGKGAVHSTNTTTISNTYTKVGTMAASVRDASHFWIGDTELCGNGVYFASSQGSGNSVGCGDYCYYSMYNPPAWRECLLFGDLRDGSAGGLRYLLCNHGLAAAAWYFAASD